MKGVFSIIFSVIYNGLSVQIVDVWINFIKYTLFVRGETISIDCFLCLSFVLFCQLCTLISIITLRILRIHVTSPILGERISAIILTQQRKQWLSVELNRWRPERIHCYFENNKNRTLIIIM